MKRIGLPILLLWLSVAFASVQSDDAPYEEATIIAVKEQHATQKRDESQSYIVTLRLKSKDYDVLYTPPGGSNRAMLSQGQSILVKVGTDSLAYRDVMGRRIELPILKPAPHR